VGLIVPDRPFDPTRANLEQISRDARTSLDTVAGYVAILKDELGGEDTAFEPEFEHIHRGLSEILQAVTQLEQTASQARDHAERDPLTGLANRRQLFDVGERWMRAPEPLCAILLDLDGFKEVNDALGHQAGDALLIGVADRIRSALRENDLLCRLGGDEFVVLLRTDEAVASRVQARILDVVARATFDLGRGEVRIGISAGMAERHPDHTTLDSLLAVADARMYTSKRRASSRHPTFVGRTDG
jgi:diguanylate cyclase (GGDEF)-like protein